MDYELTGTESGRARGGRAIVAGAVGGFVAGIPMGLIFQFGTEILPVLGQLTGAMSVLRGWLVHLTLSVLYGALFAAIVSSRPLAGVVSSFDVTEYALAGIVYATMMAAVTLGVLPFIYDAPWVPASRAPITQIPGPSLGGLVGAALVGVGHIIYGAVLGGAYASFGVARGTSG